MNLLPITFFSAFLPGCTSQDKIEPDRPLDLPEPDSDTSTTDSDTATPDECGEDACEGILDANRLSETTTLCITFDEQAAAASLTSTAPHLGLSVADYDSDGAPDIYINNYGTPNQLFRNLGSGQFSDVSLAARLNVGGDTNDVAWNDYDGDGDLDVLLASNSGSILYNNDDGVFTAPSEPQGIHDAFSGTAAAWIGSDIVIGTDSGLRYYQHTSGSSSFTLATTASGLVDVGDANAFAATDSDNDGDDDLYVANTAGENRFFINNGNGTFASAEDTMGLTDSDGQASADASWIDIDATRPNTLSVCDLDGVNELFVKTGDTYTDQAREIGISDGGNSMTCPWGTYGPVNSPAQFIGRWEQSNLLFLPTLSEDGSVARYQDAAYLLGMDLADQTVGAKWADVNSDGFDDLIAVTFTGSVLLYMNKSHEVQVCNEE